MKLNEARPISPADPETKRFWDATAEERLLLQRCDGCGHTQLYPRSVCAACHDTSLTWIQSDGRGSVYSFTVVHRAPHPAFAPPYTVALVRLDEGPVVMTNIDGEIACDARVRLRWEDLPDGRKLPVFERDPNGL